MSIYEILPALDLTQSVHAKISYELILQKKFTESIIIDNTIQLLTFIEVNIIQIQPFYEVDTSFHAGKVGFSAVCQAIYS
jgi:hypothetical protein